MTLPVCHRCRTQFGNAFVQRLGKHQCAACLERELDEAHTLIRDMRDRQYVHEKHGKRGPGTCGLCKWIRRADEFLRGSWI